MTKILILTIIPCLTAFIMAASHAQARPAALYVAANGSDRWSGRLPAPNRAKTDGPFRTLERARDEIRTLKQTVKLPRGGMTVEVRGGVYELARSFDLTEQDSGTAESPVVYRARPGEEVRLVGGKVLTGFEPVTDRAILERLEPAARGKVLQTDLRAQGITDMPRIRAGMGWAQSDAGLELFFQDKPMTLARWPNRGFVKIVDTLNIEPYDIRGTWGDKVGKFLYEGDRPKRWAGEKEIWLHGYWFWDWADERERVESIDTEKRVITLAKPYHAYGYRKGQWYYAFNILAELDEPGEWYLDRDTGILYFWPPAPDKQDLRPRANVESGRPMVSVVPTLVTLKNASYVTLRGMILEAARGTAITVEGGAGVRIAGCAIRNTGKWAASISGATDSGVAGCDIYQTGEGGISLEGGDRKTLTPCNLYADNNHIHHYARWNPVYKPAVMIGGCGCRVTHNLIDNAPHMAIGFSGNDHRIEYNEIHSVCYESNDAGAMYAGRNWTMRGTVIRYNYLHHINGFEGRGCVGVYLDDQWCGTQIVGNIFWKVTRAAMIGGGRDCAIENNIFVDCVPATHVDARGLGWAASGFEGLKAGLEAMPYKQPPWSARYPQLVNILNDDPMAPKGNVIARNICVGGRWGDFEPKAKPMVTFTDNLLDEDPHFMDAARGDFRLRPDSPALKLGFKPIPIEKIGPYKSAERASWPVRSAVRPMAEPPKPVGQTRRAIGPPPVWTVKRATAPIIVDGDIKPLEWRETLLSSRTLVIEQGIQGERARPHSLAWLVHDKDALYIAFDNVVDSSKPLRMGATWGQDDAVEIALSPLAKGGHRGVERGRGGEGAPVLILRGYPNGRFESSDEAGAPAAAVRRAAEGVQYKASVPGPDRWVCEWRIPFASLGINPAKQRRFACNLSVRKTAGDQWVMWRGTGGYTWDVDRAGFLELAR
jgi:hypothetical protein